MLAQVILTVKATRSAGYELVYVQMHDMHPPGSSFISKHYPYAARFRGNIPSQRAGTGMLTTWDHKT